MSADKPEDKGEKPKIVVDEDWKASAQAEKEKLASQEKATSARAGPAGGPAASAAGGPQARALPPASVATLVSGIALGAIEDPQTKRRYRDMALAKHQIDLLAVLEEKTKGNLTEEEKRLLDQALYEVRMQYVRVAQSG